MDGFDLEHVIQKEYSNYDACPEYHHEQQSDYLGSVHTQKELLGLHVQPKVVVAVHAINLLFPKYKSCHTIRMTYFVTARAHLYEL